MIISGRHLKEFNLKSTNIGYEINSSFTRLLSPSTRTSERAKSASLNKIKFQFDKKKKKLESFEERLSFEKEKFAKFETYTNFVDRVNSIIENR